MFNFIDEAKQTVTSWVLADANPAGIIALTEIVRIILHTY